MSQRSFTESLLAVFLIFDAILYVLSACSGVISIPCSARMSLNLFTLLVIWLLLRNALGLVEAVVDGHHDFAVVELV